MSISPLSITPLTAGDRAPWEALARGYKLFYETDTTDAEYDLAFRRLVARDEVLGLGARLDGALVGITHYLFHASVWSGPVCYLQDLFVSPAARGRGVARALIGAVGQAAREARAARCYWMTRDNNAVARVLYEQVARHNGFIRYDLPLH
ncbi:MAG: GNAT family N-acetyltransferase [Rhizobacter sp.]|nr:GNAT family N-acetyltransferase [Rhizobacter sp.]